MHQLCLFITSFPVDNSPSPQPVRIALAGRLFRFTGFVDHDFVICAGLGFTVTVAVDGGDVERADLHIVLVEMSAVFADKDVHRITSKIVYAIFA